MNRATRSVLTTLSIVSLSGLFACGGDKNPTGPGKIGSSDQATAAALLNGVVTPIVRDLVIEGYLAAAPAAAPVPSPTACENLSFCSSGSVEACSGPGTLDLTFTDCNALETVINGTISLAIATGSGTGTVSLELADGFSMSGTVSYTDDGSCFSQYFTGVTITTGNLEMAMSGSAFWCEPRAMAGNVVVPDYADFVFEIPSIDRTVDISVFSDPPGFLEIVILNLARTKILTGCHGNLPEPALDCFAGPDA